MSRIPYPTDDQLSPAKLERKYNTSRRLLNVTKMAMHSTEGMWKAFVDIGMASIYDTEIDIRHREMVILRVAYIEDSEYELFHHLSIARGVGVTDDEIEALKTGDYSKLGAKERALVEFTDGTVKGSASDAEVAAMVEHFSVPLAFETVLVIGQYMMTARVANLGGIEIEEEPISVWAKRT